MMMIACLQTQIVDFLTRKSWLSHPPTAKAVARSSVFRFSSPKGWPCLYIDTRYPDLLAAQEALEASADYIAKMSATIVGQVIVDAVSVVEGVPLMHKASMIDPLLEADEGDSDEEDDDDGEAEDLDDLNDEDQAAAAAEAAGLRKRMEDTMHMELVHAIPLVERLSVLDLCCDEGAVSAALVREHMDIQLHVLDQSAERVAITVDHIRQASMEKHGLPAPRFGLQVHVHTIVVPDDSGPFIPMPGSPYDVIMGSYVQSLVCGSSGAEEDLARRYVNLYRVLFASLQPGGRLVLGDHVGGISIFKQLMYMDRAGFLDVDFTWRHRGLCVCTGRKEGVMVPSSMPECFSGPPQIVSALSQSSTLARSAMPALRASGDPPPVPSPTASKSTSAVSRSRPSTSASASASAVSASRAQTAAGGASAAGQSARLGSSRSVGSARSSVSAGSSPQKASARPSGSASSRSDLPPSQSPVIKTETQFFGNGK